MSVKSRFTDYVLQHRIWFIITPVVISLFMIIPMKNATINSDLNSYLYSDIPVRINQEKLKEIFGSDEPVIIFIRTDNILKQSTLERIQDLSKAFGRAREFDKVISLFDLKDIKGEYGSMIVDPAVKRIPKSETRREKLREQIKNNDLVYKTIISEDFRNSIIILFPANNITDKELIASVQEQLKAIPGDEEVYLSGSPYLRYEIQRKATRDLIILLPIGLLLMLLFLYFSFHEIKGVFLPFAVVIMSIILSMGLIPLSGWDFSLIAILVPILMIAIANNYGVHIISRYQELNALHPDWDMKHIVSDTMKHLHNPIILTALTTITGILGMAAQIMIPTKQMGIVSAIGVFFALILSLTLIPAILSGLKKGKIHTSFTGTRQTFIDRILKQFGNWAMGKPRYVIVVFAIVLVVSGIGIARLKVSVSNENILPPSNPLRIANTIVDKDFGGTKTVTLLFEGDIKSPVVMQTMDRYEQELEKIPEVGKTTSLAGIIRTISRALNNPGDSLYDIIPGTRDAIAQYIELYSMNGDPEDFEKLVNFGYTQASLSVHFRANDAKTFNRILSKIDSLQKASPYCTMEGGYSLMEKVFSESVVKGQIYSLLFAILAIAILLFLIFRSIKAGLMGSLPLLFALVCNFGLMGWMGIELDIATSLLSSIAIGIGVDYTIHLFWRLKSELREGKQIDEAIKKTLLTTGRGITINAFSVMLGFAVLFISALTILKTFAFLIIISLLLCLLSALLLIPALSYIFRPAFLWKNNNSKNKKQNV